MSDTGLSPVVEPGAVAAGPAYQAYQMLHFAFTVAPIIAGLDKFFMYLATWHNYLAPIFPRILNVAPDNFMKGVGVIEIIAGLLVGFKPRIGAWIVGLWLCGIIVNLFLVPGIWNFHAGHTWGLDLALRDLGLALGAFALARLSVLYDRPVVTTA